MMKRVAYFGALALAAALSTQAAAQQGGGGGGGGLGDTGLGDARAHNLPTAQGINNGYENGVYFGGYAGSPTFGGSNSPLQSYERGPGYAYAPGYGRQAGVYQGRSAYITAYRHRRHHRHW
jgi:hypothetical protein